MNFFEKHDKEMRKNRLLQAAAILLTKYISEPNWNRDDQIFKAIYDARQLEKELLRQEGES